MKYSKSVLVNKPLTATRNHVRIEQIGQFSASAKFVSRNKSTITINVSGIKIVLNERADLIQLTYELVSVSSRLNPISSFTLRISLGEDGLATKVDVGIDAQIRGFGFIVRAVEKEIREFVDTYLIKFKKFVENAKD